MYLRTTALFSSVDIVLSFDVTAALQLDFLHLAADRQVAGNIAQTALPQTGGADGAPAALHYTGRAPVPPPLPHPDLGACPPPPRRRDPDPWAAHEQLYGTWRCCRSFCFAGSPRRS